MAIGQSQAGAGFPPELTGREKELLRFLDKKGSTYAKEAWVETDVGSYKTVQKKLRRLVELDLASVKNEWSTGSKKWYSLTDTGREVKGLL